MSPPSNLYLGLMSGTSLDGIDCALVDFSGAQPAVIATTLHRFTDKLRATLLVLQASSADELHQAQLAANALVDAYADAVSDVLQQANIAPHSVAAIGMHGQTIRHRPELGYTVQIGNAARLAEVTGITVVSDFRSRDVAAGGQGAPLVPAFHCGVFGGQTHRAIVNIGGIANVTDLPINGAVHGWDTGPGNVLLDGWIARHLGLAYDDNGTWGTQGQLIEPLLNAMLSNTYFDSPPPKSTGRDLFHLAWLDQHLAHFPLATPVDVQATLVALTAVSIATDIQKHAPGAMEIYVCGGGARNSALMTALTDLLAPIYVDSTSALGLHPDWVEAVAFAWLAKQCLMGRPANLPAVTGAKGLRILGAIYPA